MKNTILFFWLITGSTIVQAMNIDVSISSNKQLTDKMKAFFTETLSNNYHGTSEVELYNQFLMDYFEAWTEVGATEYSDLKLKIDVEKLKEINGDLFRRDLLHYYYYFPEVIFLKPSDDIAKAKERYLNNTKIPIVLKSPSIILSKQKPTLTNLRKTHVSLLNYPEGFWKHIQQYDLKTVSYINQTMPNIGEIPFFNFTTFLLKTDASKELEKEIVQEIVAVIFWKYLCIEADIDFYSKPN
ncbi:hypothetical protein [uncultured Draconibacterium sp.]|uniref:hypothetical protein n=1 Tax=uncultured Draconibacterium sp. TaxID=1573823 RepID=UPI0029C70619|nr:hypothetical protein [uncultured Draconibacterium sp.]